MGGCEGANGDEGKGNAASVEPLLGEVIQGHTCERGTNRNAGQKEHRQRGTGWWDLTKLREQNGKFQVLFEARKRGLSGSRRRELKKPKWGASRKVRTPL
jgi:hypothetical protein